MAQLNRDPRSRFHAAVHGWSHPVSWSDIIAMDAIDKATARVTPEGQQFTPYERPWTKKKPTRGRPKKRRTAEEAMKVLRPHKAGTPPTPPV